MEREANGGEVEEGAPKTRACSDRKNQDRVANQAMWTAGHWFLSVCDRFGGRVGVRLVGLDLAGANMFAGLD